VTPSADSHDHGPVAERALQSAQALGLEAELIRHEPVRSLEEAAVARGVEPADVVKSMVVRRGEADYLLFLVPGDRVISWPKARELLDVNRMSMPDADEARQVTGYTRGTITPFGLATPLPVVADERLCGRRVTLGSGEHNTAIAVDADATLDALGATVADVTDPA
jgi:Cys-tRNA(Pro)/Cys-tRNA(Cys) deacylase